MKKLALLLILLISLVSFLVFHDKGNELIRPLVSTYLECKTENNSSIEVTHLKVDYKYMEINALVNTNSLFKAQGDYDLLEQTLDFNYSVETQGFENETISFKEKIDINGTAKGAFDSIHLKGKGETLESTIDYSLILENENTKEIHVKIKEADITTLLQLTVQPNYAKGKVDINIDIPLLSKRQTKGSANIQLKSVELNSKTFNQNFKLNLPKHTKLNSDLNLSLTSELIQLNGTLQSNLADLRLFNTTINPKTKVLNAKYQLIIPELSKLNSLTKQDLQGKMAIQGEMKTTTKSYSLEGKTKSLGGELDFILTPQKVSSNLEQVRLEKLLYLLNQKNYASGTLIGEIDLDLSKELTGNFNFSSKKAQTNHQTLKQELDINFGKNIPFVFTTLGTINQGVVKVQSSLNSDILNYHSNDIAYSLKNQNLNSTYTLNISNIAKLKTLLGKTLRGSVDIRGQLNHDKTLYLTGLTKSLGGEVNFELNNELLTSQLNNIPVSKLMYLLDYPNVFKANLIGSLNYNLASKQGTFNSQLNQAQLIANNLTELIKQVRGIDLTKERYNESHFNAKINQELVDIDFQAKSNKVLFQIPSGVINTNNNQINADYTININNKDLSGKIKGHISKPNITVDSSQFIKNEVKEIIKQNVDDKTIKDLGIGEEEKKVIKNLLGDLFR